MARRQIPYSKLNKDARKRSATVRLNLHEKDNRGNQKPNARTKKLLNDYNHQVDQYNSLATSSIVPISAKPHFLYAEINFWIGIDAGLA